MDYLEIALGDISLSDCYLNQSNYESGQIIIYVTNVFMDQLCIFIYTHLLTALFWLENTLENIWKERPRKTEWQS